MGFFSEELREMDRNTVRYMIDELQKEVDTQKALLEEKDTVIAEKEMPSLQICRPNWQKNNVLLTVITSFK